MWRRRRRHSTPIAPAAEGGETNNELREGEAEIVTWDPTAMGSNIVLSNGNLTATKAVDIDFVSGLGTTPKTLQFAYFEVEADAYSAAVNFAAIGVGTADTNLENYLGINLESVGYYADGSVYKNNSAVAALAAYSAGDRLGCAYNGTTGKGWFSKNGVFASGDPALGTGEHFTFTAGTPLFPGFTLIDVDDQVTVAFLRSAFESTPPTGFVAWDLDGGGQELREDGGKELREDG